MTQMQRKYKITLIDRLLGTIPKNKELFTKYVLAKYNNEYPQEEGQEAENEMSTLDAMSPAGNGETGFFTDPDGIYIMDYHVKGFLKEAGNILKDNLKIKALRSKIENFVFVEPRFIWLADAPHGRLERPIRAQTMKGPRTSLVSSDYVEAGTAFDITITLIPHQEITWHVIEALLDYGRFKGIGQWRNGGYGRFKWKRIS